MLYRYQCPECGSVQDDTQFAPLGEFGPDCLDCHAEGLILTRMQRVASFSYKRSMPEHYNHTTNTVVKSENHYKSELSRLSDIQSERTGQYHNYQPVDPTDKAGLGVTDEGMDATRKRKRDAGETQPKQRIIV